MAGGLRRLRAMHEVAGTAICGWPECKFNTNVTIFFLGNLVWIILNSTFLINLSQVGGLTISKPTTAAASKAPEAHSVASSAPASESDVEALETIDLCENEEEGASGGASYVPPKNEGSSEPDNSEENGSEEESTSEVELSSQSDDKENATEDSSLSPTSSEMSSLVGFSETENETEDETENDQEGEEQVRPSNMMVLYLCFWKSVYITKCPLTKPNSNITYFTFISKGERFAAGHW